MIKSGDHITENRHLLEGKWLFLLSLKNTHLQFFLDSNVYCNKLCILLVNRKNIDNDGSRNIYN